MVIDMEMEEKMVISQMWSDEMVLEVEMMLVKCSQVRWWLI